MKTALAVAITLSAAVSGAAFAADGLDLGALKPKTADSATSPGTNPASTPIGMSPLKKPATDTAATGATGTAPGTKINPLGKGMFGSTPGKADAAAADTSTSDDVKVKMPSNFKK